MTDPIEEKWKAVQEGARRSRKRTAEREKQVRELVLAAREHVSQSAGWPSDSGRKARLRAALEPLQ